MKPLNIAMMCLTHGHTRKYFQVLRDSSKLNWIAASEPSEEFRARFARKVDGIPCYASAEEMLSRHPEIEAVVIASPNDEHLEHMRLCAERGLHILSMKIPTFDLDEYDAMIEAVDKAGVVCQVELELHYNPVVRRVLSLIESGRLGALRSIQATNVTLSPVWAFPWQGSPEKSYGRRVPLAPDDTRFRGGALADHPHVFDLIRWMTNSDFDWVYAKAAPNLRTDLEVEDLLFVNGAMKDGTTFLFDPSWSRTEERLLEPGPGWEIYPKRMEVDLTIAGEKAHLTADCFGPNIYHNGTPQNRYVVEYTYFDEWIGLIDEFVTSIRLGREPKINLTWHRRTIEVMNACYESMGSGKRQTMKDEG